ncbi:XdhC family protein [Sporosarcina luteola]|uniref:XdhC family protein n=1 Tax=Sporosarcina luteola TaxID=582850 RepID=UPI00203FF385|nr:XdhC family protein [Sporosarcina luteola]MCM3743118.1 XdhC family protein [Sporosarcina luteola]
MGSIPQLVEKLIESGQAAVLAKVIHVEGSAYRKEGAWMFFLEDGSRIGMLSGGCLENDLQSRTKEMFRTGSVKICEFDLRAEDDLGWGRGAGCNGVVTVMLRDVDAIFNESLGFLSEQLKQGRPVQFVQSLENEYGFCFASSSEKRGTLTKFFSIAEMHPFQHSAGRKWIKDEFFYHQWIWPAPSLYLFGAGADARPFAALATSVGYSVNVCDWRESNCTQEHFPTAVSFNIGPIHELLNRITFTELDSVVIMTHDFQADQQILQTLQNQKLLYAGLLGSKKRTERLLDHPIPEWLHSPIGLSIGADGPEEIAVSIIAEMIAVRKRRTICTSLASI